MLFGHCHHTRFRDSFCLASVFEKTVYLLTYLLSGKMYGYVRLVCYLRRLRRMLLFTQSFTYSIK